MARDKAEVRTEAVAGGKAETRTGAMAGSKAAARTRTVSGNGNPASVGVTTEEKNRQEKRPLMGTVGRICVNRIC